MTGQTIQRLMRLTDPDVRFRMADGAVMTADAIAKLHRIPACDRGAIYGLFESDDGFVVIGIAQDPASDIPCEEWIADQLERPALKSIDRVDVFGMRIRDLTEGGDSNATQR
jgi:hypothetical protein